MSYLTDNSTEEGAGPFLFDSPELAPGESWNVELRNVEWHGKKRGLRRYAPFDTASVTNSNDVARVRATYNGQYEASILPNTVETFDRQGVSEVRITNTDSAETIPAGEIEIEVTEEPYGADDRALEQRQRGPVGNVIEKFTGLSIGGGR